MEALLALEDGAVFSGRSLGVPGERYGEVVFNTSLTGYQEVLTDPSCRGQMVAMAAPQIGNTGINPEDMESERPQVEALLLRQASPAASSWRARQSLGRFLREHGTLALADIDTRALTRHLRSHGALKAVASTEDLSPESLVEKARASAGISSRNWVADVSCRAPYEWTVGAPAGWGPAAWPGAAVKRHIVVVDCGAKQSILRYLVDRGCRLTLVPWNTPAAEILALDPDGIVLSNGPGDPMQAPELAEAVRGLLGRTPILGIGLGHQMLGLAYGGRTFKLRCGHHGGNQPVLDLASGRVEITAQNHGFSVDAASLCEDEVAVTHINLNDRTVEGMRHRRWPAWGVQYQPEGGPRPHGAVPLLDEFVAFVDEWRIAYWEAPFAQAD